MIQVINAQEFHVETCFQQGGTVTQIARPTSNLLKTVFSNYRLIKFGNVNWPLCFSSQSKGTEIALR